MITVSVPLFKPKGYKEHKSESDVNLCIFTPITVFWLHTTPKCFTVIVPDKALLNEESNYKRFSVTTLCGILLQKEEITYFSSKAAVTNRTTKTALAQVIIPFRLQIKLKTTIWTYIANR